jgi:hypothetical protein
MNNTFRSLKGKVNPLYAYYIYYIVLTVCILLSLGFSTKGYVESQKIPWSEDERTRREQSMRRSYGLSLTFMVIAVVMVMTGLVYTNRPAVAEH